MHQRLDRADIDDAPLAGVQRRPLNQTNNGFSTLGRLPCFLSRSLKASTSGLKSDLPIGGSKRAEPLNKGGGVGDILCVADQLI